MIVRRFLVAVGFLTRIRVGAVHADADELQRATGAFPLVGLLVATIVVAVRWLAGLALPDVAATVFAVAVGAIVTGAFHEDGFADTFDGLWGGSTPERRLEIMRDSRLGTYGVLALVLLMAAKVSLLAPLSVGGFARAIAAGMVLGRASSLPLMRWMPAAPGSSAALAGRPSVVSLAVAVTTVVVSVGVAFGVWAWLPLVVCAAVSVVCAWVIRRKLGGITGDVLGATNQLVEVAVIACATTLVTRGLLS